MITQKVITIVLGLDEDIATALQEVARLASEGYTSGNSPAWQIEEE
jgi:hypothetical protein